MAAPVPGGKNWSASNATHGATYETTGPMVTELPTGKFGDITKFGGSMFTSEDVRSLFPKIAEILKQAEEGGGGGGNPEMEAMKMEHAEENHEQDMRHSEELHQLKVQMQSLALQQKQEAMAMKQQEAGMQMPPEPPPPLDPQQGQGMIDAAYQNSQNRDPQVGPLKEGAYVEGYKNTLQQLGLFF
jgi:hypothetical protein